MTKEEKNKIEDLRMQGLGYTKIAQNLGLSINTVKSYCRRNLPGHSNDQDSVEEQHRCKNCGCEVLQNPGRKEKMFCSDKCRKGEV